MAATDIGIRFKNAREVEEYAQEKNKLLLLMDDYVLDATSFAPYHPGGAILIQQMKLKNIDTEMKFHHPLTLKMASTLTIGSFKTEISRIIDPTKPLLPQIWKLDHQQYLKVVDSPHWLFEATPRLFQSDFFQFFSHTKWHQIIYLPIFMITVLALEVPDWHTHHPVTLLLASILGLLLYSLTQYFIHRCIFHSQSFIPNLKLTRCLHFLLHGIHHVLPSDPDRLVLPPVVSLLLFTLVNYTLVRIVGIQDKLIFFFFWSAFIIGYVLYDFTHYALHHIDTSKMKGSYFHRLQKHHNQHHYGGEDAGYGVSSKLWDIILRSDYKNKTS